MLLKEGNTFCVSLCAVMSHSVCDAGWADRLSRALCKQSRQSRMCAVYAVMQYFFFSSLFVLCFLSVRDILRVGNRVFACV